MMQNLSLMIVDLKEYLLQKRMSKLDFVSKDFLTNSIDYMKACRNYQSRYLHNNIQKAIRHQIHPTDERIIEVARSNTTKLIQPRNFDSLPKIIQENDMNMSLKLDKVNDYWKKSNDIVTSFNAQLAEPMDKRKQIIQINPHLVKDYVSEKNKSSIPSFEWEANPFTKKETENANEEENKKTEGQKKSVEIEEKQTNRSGQNENE